MIKKMFNKFLKICFLFVFLLGCSLQSRADCGITIDPKDCNGDPDGEEEVPLDSGVVVLIISSIAFSIVAIKKKDINAAGKAG